jgi:hypothetical protein
LGIEVVVMVKPVPIVMDRARMGEVFPALSFIVTLKANVPLVVGVPLIAPVDAFRLRPASSPPDPGTTVQLQ